MSCVMRILSALVAFFTTGLALPVASSPVTYRTDSSAMETHGSPVFIATLWEEINYDLDPLRMLMLDNTTKSELLQDDSGCRTLNDKVNRFGGAVQDGSVKDRAHSVRNIATSGIYWMDRCPLSVYATLQLTMYFRLNRAWSAAMLGRDDYGDIEYMSDLMLLCARSGGNQSTLCNLNLGVVNHFKEKLRENAAASPTPLQPTPRPPPPIVAARPTAQPSQQRSAPPAASGGAVAAALQGAWEVTEANVVYGAMVWRGNARPNGNTVVVDLHKASVGGQAATSCERRTILHVAFSIDDVNRAVPYTEVNCAGAAASGEVRLSGISADRRAFNGSFWQGGAILGNFEARKL